MHKIKCFDDWVEDENPFGSGASEKIVLKHPTTQSVGIFKFPKNFTDKEKNDCGITGEYWAEKLAAVIANEIGIECAKVDIGTYNGRMGSMSYVFTRDDLTLIEGIHLILYKYPEYDPYKFTTKDGSAIYSVQMILECLPARRASEIKGILNIIVFDCLIGNSDRHQSNWGLLVKHDPVSSRPVSSCIAPLYDNGSSLCCYIPNPLDYLRDRMRLNGLVYTKAKSRIGWEDIKKPRHFDVLRSVVKEYPTYVDDVITKIEKNLNKDVFSSMIEEFSDDIINKDMKELLLVYLIKKRENILEIYREEKE